MQVRWRRIARVVGQTLLGFVFLVAGSGKLLDGNGITRERISGTGWLTSDRALAAARVLPWTELALACWLISGWRPRTAAAICACVLLVFGLGLVRIGDRIGWGAECGCLVHLPGKATIITGLIRNALLFAISVWLAISKPLSTGETVPKMQDESAD